MALNFKNLFVYITIVSTILSSVLYVGIASLYHFCIAIAFIIAWNHKNSRLENICKTNEMLQFMLIWFVYSIFSLIWAPDKKLCIQYIYYILLIFLYFCVMIDHIDEREKIYKMVHFFIILSVVATTIGLWEASTGKHLLKDYIDTEGRLKLQYMPGFTYRNPNDFAMFLLQMFPFILYGMIYEKRLLFKIMSIYSVLTTFICVAACQSRTILIVILIFSLVTVLKMFQDKWGRILFAIIAIAIVLSSVPQFSTWLKDALVDLDAKNLQTSISTEGNSGLVRINLAKNGVLMCLHPKAQIIAPSVPRNLKKVSTVSPSSGAQATSFTSASVAGVQAGQMIEHERFGLGEVIKVEGTGDNAKATIHFKNAGDKQLLLRFARFKVVE